MTSISQLSWWPTAADVKSISQRQSQLQDQIDDFHKKAIQFWGPPAEFEDIEWEDLRFNKEEASESESESEGYDDNVFLLVSPLETPGAPECRPLLLPSTLGVNVYNILGYKLLCSARIGSLNWTCQRNLAGSPPVPQQESGDLSRRPLISQI
jgi:hypothetical protein